MLYKTLCTRTFVGSSSDRLLQH